MKLPESGISQFVHRKSLHLEQVNIVVTIAR